METRRKDRISDFYKQHIDLELPALNYVTRMREKIGEIGLAETSPAALGSLVKRLEAGPDPWTIQELLGKGLSEARLQGLRQATSVQSEIVSIASAHAAEVLDKIGYNLIGQGGRLRNSFAVTLDFPAPESFEAIAAVLGRGFAGAAISKQMMEMIKSVLGPVGIELRVDGRSLIIQREDGALRAKLAREADYGAPDPALQRAFQAGRDRASAEGEKIQTASRLISAQIITQAVTKLEVAAKNGIELFGRALARAREEPDRLHATAKLPIAIDLADVPKELLASYEWGLKEHPQTVWAEVKRQVDTHLKAVGGQSYRVVNLGPNLLEVERLDRRGLRD